MVHQAEGWSKYGKDNHTSSDIFILNLKTFNIKKY